MPRGNPSTGAVSSSAWGRQTSFQVKSWQKERNLGMMQPLQVPLSRGVCWVVHFPLQLAGPVFSRGHQAGSPEEGAKRSQPRTCVSASPHLQQPQHHHSCRPGIHPASPQGLFLSLGRTEQFRSLVRHSCPPSSGICQESATCQTLSSTPMLPFQLAEGWYLWPK
jgi:hypothetical protein